MRRHKNQYIFAGDSRRFRRPHHVLRGLLAVILLLALTFFVSNFTVSNRVRVEEERLTVLNLPVDLEEYSILHISDLHGARYGEKQKAIKTALGNMRYSCVVMTGDMLGENGDVEPLLELIAVLPPDTPKYLIPGDMDGPLIDTDAHGSLSPYADWAGAGGFPERGRSGPGPGAGSGAGADCRGPGDQKGIQTGGYPDCGVPYAPDGGLPEGHDFLDGEGVVFFRPLREPDSRRAL